MHINLLLYALKYFHLAVLVGLGLANQVAVLKRQWLIAT